MACDPTVSGIPVHLHIFRLRKRYQETGLEELNDCR